MGLLNRTIKHMRDMRKRWISRQLIGKYLRGNRIPWSEGYEDYKWEKISEALNDSEILSSFTSKELPLHYGSGLDERIVEYPFVFSRLPDRNAKLLDAGSTFNFSPIVSHPILSSKELTIFTLLPEQWNFASRKISYHYGDIRKLPFKDEWFDEVVCISTLEHVGMDNSIYGHDQGGEQTGEPGRPEYMKAIAELVRVLRGGGNLFLTFPFGKKINYGYFQQFDADMVSKIKEAFVMDGKSGFFFYEYTSSGWLLSTESKCTGAVAYNPHTGEGKGNDGAAHSRAICAIHFIKKE